VAVRSDLKNISMFLAAYSRFLHEGLDGKELAKELGERIMEELDYELEAANTRAMARAFRGHPFIRVPDVVTELSTQRVLVTEWLDGRPLSSVYDAPLETRNRVAEILFRFYIGGPYRLRTYSGDPHPGNSLVLADGTVGFLDFGLVKTVDAETSNAELASFRATIEGDATGLVQILHERGFIPDPAAADADVTLEAMMRASYWYLHDEEIEITPSVANRIASEFVDPRTDIGAESRKNNLPADHAFRGRAELHLAAILGQLRPQINLHPIAREWIYGDDPVTELGIAQQAWEQGSDRLVMA
jgi:predicted unusual protein kinase regulating ubiquinone biosynthesis (AarF/ABC1/UbiB family)